MKWLIAGMRNEFVESFVQWMKENGIRVAEPFDNDGIWTVMYMPITRHDITIDPNEYPWVVAWENCMARF